MMMIMITLLVSSMSAHVMLEHHYRRRRRQYHHGNNDGESEPSLLPHRMATSGTPAQAFSTSTTTAVTSSSSSYETPMKEGRVNGGIVTSTLTTSGRCNSMEENTHRGESRRQQRPPLEQRLLLLLLEGMAAPVTLIRSRMGCFVAGRSSWLRWWWWCQESIRNKDDDHDDDWKIHPLAAAWEISLLGTCIQQSWIYEILLTTIYALSILIRRVVAVIGWFGAGAAANHPPSLDGDDVMFRTPPPSTTTTIPSSKTIQSSRPLTSVLKKPGTRGTGGMGNPTPRRSSTTTTTTSRVAFSENANGQIRTSLRYYFPERQVMERPPIDPNGDEAESARVMKTTLTAGTTTKPIARTTTTTRTDTPHFTSTPHPSPMVISGKENWNEIGSDVGAVSTGTINTEKEQEISNVPHGSPHNPHTVVPPPTTPLPRGQRRAHTQILLTRVQALKQREQLLLRKRPLVETTTTIPGVKGDDNDDNQNNCDDDDDNNNNTTNTNGVKCIGTMEPPMKRRDPRWLLTDRSNLHGRVPLTGTKGFVARPVPVHIRKRRQREELLWQSLMVSKPSTPTNHMETQYPIPLHNHSWRWGNHP